MRRLMTMVLVLMLCAWAMAEYKTLKEGDTGIEVVFLQDRLRELSFLGPVENGYGEKTVDAVKAFQEAAGLEMTGIADAATQEALYSKDAYTQYENTFSDADYKSIMRDPVSTWRKAFVIRGVVIQTIEDYKYDHYNVKMLVATKDTTDNIILVEYSRHDGDTRILEGDSISFSGEAHGTKTYKTISGMKNEVPMFTTYEINIEQE